MEISKEIIEVLFCANGENQMGGLGVGSEK
jgi:hypothetical protein